MLRMVVSVYRFRYMAGGWRGTPYHDGNIEVKAGSRDIAEAIAMDLVSRNMRMGPSLVTLEYVSERP
jgi:hypothetical protein